MNQGHIVLQRMLESLMSSLHVSQSISLGKRQREEAGGSRPFRVNVAHGTHRKPGGGWGLGWGGWTDAHVLDLNRDGQLAQGAMTGDNLGEFGHPLFTTAELRANCGSFSGKNIKRAFIYGSASSALEIGRAHV